MRGRYDVRGLNLMISVQGGGNIISRQISAHKKKFHVDIVDGKESRKH